MKLYAPGEDYLEAVLILQKKQGMVRSVDVARHMDVSKASVSHAVAALRKIGFLTMDEDFSLHLTDAGRELAEQIYERHCFFREQLLSAGVDPETAEVEACRMEHAISQESFERIREAYEKRELDTKQSLARLPTDDPSVGNPAGGFIFAEELNLC